MTVMALVIIVYKYKLRPEFPGGVFYVRSARTYTNGCKSLNRPDSGKVTAKGKGVRRRPFRCMIFGAIFDPLDR